VKQPWHIDLAKPLTEKEELDMALLKFAVDQALNGRPALLKDLAGGKE